MRALPLSLGELAPLTCSILFFNDVRAPPCGSLSTCKCIQKLPMLVYFQLLSVEDIS